MLQTFKSANQHGRNCTVKIYQQIWAGTDNRLQTFSSASSNLEGRNHLEMIYLRQWNRTLTFQDMSSSSEYSSSFSSSSSSVSISPSSSSPFSSYNKKMLPFSKFDNSTKSIRVNKAKGFLLRNCSLDHKLIVPDRFQWEYQCEVPSLWSICERAPQKPGDRTRGVHHHLR